MTKEDKNFINARLKDHKLKRFEDEIDVAQKIAWARNCIRAAERCINTEQYDSARLSCKDALIILSEALDITAWILHKVRLDFEVEFPSLFEAVDEDNRND